MRDRDASDLEIQAMLEFVEQSIRWREELTNREPLVCALEGRQQAFPTKPRNGAAGTDGPQVLAAR